MKRPKRSSRKWWETSSPPPSDELAALIDRHPGKFSDAAFWLPEEHSSWFDAFHDVDRHRDQRAFIALIRPFVPEEVRDYFDDFFQRNEIRLKRQRGRPATPAYDRTRAETWLEIAKEDVRDLVRRGRRVDDAIDIARKRPGLVIPFTTLKNAYLDKRASATPAKRRRPRPSGS